MNLIIRLSYSANWVRASPGVMDIENTLVAEHGGA
jgi:hypothetical protein